MSAPQTDVTVLVRERSRLPEWAVEYSLLVRHLLATGRLEELAKRLRIARAGYAGLDIALFLLAFFCWGKSSSLSLFGSESAGWGPQLAALAGRSAWPSASSLSRGLAVADRCDLDAFGVWLLGPGSGGTDLLAHPLAMATDTHGEQWAVFDFDPTVEAVRLRALPEGEDLPPPRRRAAGLCAPGYSGRHRGEIQFSITPIASAGTALWLQAGIEPGNCAMPKALEVAGDACVQAVTAAGLTPQRSLIRIDGAGGSAVALDPIAKRGIQHLVRLKSYGIFRLRAVQQLLAADTWQWVADSGSGPRRQALDIGSWQLGADEFQAATDAPVVPTRLVVSRYATDRKHGAGVLIEGWLYELFGTSLDASAWPAAETVELYYGRSAIENRFAQEARELHLHHVFSYTPAGQRLAVLVGMWLWNLRTVLGSRVVGPLGAVPTPPARVTQDVVAPPPVPEMLLPPEPVDQAPPHEPSERERVEAVLAGLAWPEMIRKHPGWRYDGTLHCPAGHVALFNGVAQTKHCRYASYRVSARHCGPCQKRELCSRTTNPTYSRVVTLPIGDALLVGRRLRGQKPVPPPLVPLPPPRWLAPAPSEPGLLQALAAALLPAELRHRWQDFASRCGAEICLPRPVPAPVRRPWVASTPGVRQHRRLTWQQHLARYELRGTARVCLDAPDKRHAQATRAVLELYAA